MNRRIIIGGGLAAVVIFAIAWYLGSPLFINRQVDEAFPVEVPSRETVEGMSESEVQALEEQFEAALPSEAELEAMPEPQREAVEQKAMEFMAAMPDKMAEEAMPAAGPQLALQGSFRDADSFHMGSGEARIYILPDGSAILRLENFQVTNGPDLHVLLAAGSPNPASSEELGEYIDLGSLKGNIGNQNYEIPAGTDPSRYKSVVIYCKPFHVVFATAALQ
jgi:hypothetical protein